jgi:two-component system, NarL family, sensor histidine kinase UhpB
LDAGRLPPAVETALYRIIQEGLTNVARHAQARTVSVVLERRDKLVRVIVEDDGIGFDPASRSRASGSGSMACKNGPSSSEGI